MAYLRPLLKLKAILDPTECCAFMKNITSLLDYCSFLKCQKKIICTIFHSQHQTNGQSFIWESFNKKSKTKKPKQIVLWQIPTVKTEKFHLKCNVM